MRIVAGTFVSRNKIRRIFRGNLLYSFVILPTNSYAEIRGLEVGEIVADLSHFQRRSFVRSSSSLALLGEDMALVSISSTSMCPNGETNENYRIAESSARIEQGA
jgi:hypothetical protein